MSHGEQLFVRGMKSEGSSDNDMWNDTALVKAYDKAMRSYKPVDMAQRIALATNVQPAKSPSWRVGMPCRATYAEDGLDYEAFILEMVDKNECVVRFVGYDNNAIVPLRELKPSHGNAARTEQIHNITTEPSWNEIRARYGIGCDPPGSAPAPRDDMECDDELRSVDTGVSTDKQSRKAKKKASKKNKKPKSKTNKQTNPLHNLFSDMPKLSNHMYTDTFPHLDHIPDLGPMPPPPLLPPAGGDPEEQEELNQLLTAWYMSGYYAGLYQSRLKRRSRNH